MAQIFQATNAIDSLRSSDFDAVSAYGEVIDNAIEANAKNIRIKTSQKQSKNRSRFVRLTQISFCDDGLGMDANTLENCLTIGWSSRFNQREGIGRFGVGMTLAAIHECKKIEVYSKQAGGDWLYICLDLDVLSTGQATELEKPTPKAPPVDLEKLAGNDHGTIVTWSKYDRQSDSAPRLVEESIKWIGRTYRYFMWDDDVNIYMDGQLIHAIDPLYCNLERTKYPDDTPALEYDPILLEWPVEELDAPEDSPKNSTITIKMSLLPECLREARGDGGNRTATDRYIDENEGISILRNKREVFYGHIPHWKSAGAGWPHFENPDRWWGGEIHFDAVLDRAFTVKNIKRGAVPNKQLKSDIKELIKSTRETCIEEVRAAWDKHDLEKKNQSTGSEKAPRPHEGAETIAKITPTDVSKIDRDKDFDTSSDDYIDTLTKHVDEEEKAGLKAIFAAQPFSIEEDTWRGTQFLESNHMGGKSVLTYNMNHSFFKCINEVLDTIQEENSTHPQTKQLKELLDLLLIAYAKAETSFNADDHMPADQFLDYVRSNWGQYLVNYVNTWKTSSMVSGTCD